jgi:prophage regulatory protein
MISPDHASRPAVARGEQMPPLQRFLRKRQVLELCGLAESTMYAMITAQQFPEPIAISAKVSVWLESAILEWQRARIAECRARAPSPNRRARRAV